MQLCQFHFYQKIARKKVARVNAAWELQKNNLTVTQEKKNILVEKLTKSLTERFRNLFPVPTQSESFAIG